MAISELTRCEYCLFFKPTGGDLNGECKRYPPVPDKSLHPNSVRVHHGDWCGEFKGNDKLKEKIREHKYD